MSKENTFQNPETLTFLHLLYDNNEINRLEIHLADSGDLQQFDKIDPNLTLPITFENLRRDSAFNGNAYFTFTSLSIGKSSAKKDDSSKIDSLNEKNKELQQQNRDLQTELNGIKKAGTSKDTDLSKATAEIEKLSKINDDLQKQLEEANAKVKAAEAQSQTGFVGNKTIETDDSSSSAKKR